MDRRDFIVAAGSSAMMMALPGAHKAAAGEGLDARARELVDAMSFEEKLLMMAGEMTRFTRQDPDRPCKGVKTPGCERLGIPGIRFIDGSRGIRCEGSTCFPAAMARGATWDPSLEQRVGQAIGYEGRAQGHNFFAGVCINLLRHPSWGRSQETFGEDPYHVGRMGAAVVTGVQNHMMACTKHFTANSIDLSRHYVDVRMDQRTLREIYLPHFKACVDAGTASIMSAYNQLNGYLCGHNRELLSGILKSEWGFEGFVISDFGAGIKDAVPAALAGCDVEMDRRKQYGWKLKLAIKAGRVPMEVIDQAVFRNVRTMLRFLPLEDNSGYDRSRVGGPEHAALAREVANKSMVLLKNENGVLPLDRKKIKTIAVIGELADSVNLGATGSTSFTPAYVVTPLEGIKRAAGESIEVVFEDGSDLDAARAAAAMADAAIVVAGLTYRDENEGSDRLRLDLSAKQEELIREIAAACPRTVVVLEGGGAITMEAWRHRVPAILMAWYSGMEGGNAVADVLFGEVNPSGKLPIVFPASKDQLYEFDNISPVVDYGYYHGYRYLDKEGIKPAYPFGHGLSYTGYRYDNLRLDKKTIGTDGVVTVKVDVTNTGTRAGEEIVQMYVGCRGSRVDRPVKDLRGFARVALDPGRTKTFSLQLSARDLAFYDVEAGKWEVEKIEYEVMAGPSSRQRDLLTAGFRVA